MLLSWSLHLTSHCLPIALYQNPRTTMNTTLNPLATKANTFHNQQHFIPSSSTSLLPKPHLPSLSFKTPLLPLSINASSSSSYPNSKPHFKSLTPLSFLKPTLITSTTATALFFTGLNFNPKLAISCPISPPPPTVDVSEDTENALEVEKQAVVSPVTTLPTGDTATVDEAVSVGNTENALPVTPPPTGGDTMAVNAVANAEILVTGVLPCVKDAVLEENTENALKAEKHEGSAPVTPPPATETAAVEVAILEDEVSYNPKDIDILRNLLGKSIKSRELVDAIRVVDKLIELQPDETEWRFMKSHVYVNNGELELAKQGFRDIILKDPYYIEAYRGLVIAAFEDDSIEEMTKIGKMVEEEIEMCVKENKGSEITRDFKLLLAQILVIESKYDDALKVYHDLEEEEPMDFRPYLCLSIIYTKLKKKDKAEKYLEKYRELVPRKDPNSKFEFMMST